MFSKRDYATNLGMLVANLHSLEFRLRAFLSKLPHARPNGLPWDVNLYSFPVGRELPESDITSYATLGRMIADYNKNATAYKIGVPISTDIVPLRDALAHGRAAATSGFENPCLIKFSPAKRGHVTVVYNAEMNEQWFTANITLLSEALDKINAALSEASRRWPESPPKSAKSSTL